MGRGWGGLMVCEGLGWSGLLWDGGWLARRIERPAPGPRPDKQPQPRANQSPTPPLRSQATPVARPPQTPSPLQDRLSRIGELEHFSRPRPIPSARESRRPESVTALRPRARPSLRLAPTPLARSGPTVAATGRVLWHDCDLVHMIQLTSSNDIC